MNPFSASPLPNPGTLESLASGHPGVGLTLIPESKTRQKHDKDTIVSGGFVKEGGPGAGREPNAAFPANSLFSVIPAAG